ncbi:MAG: carboxypeptidase-like regulatory domain-containing protein [bacterium]
MTSRSTHIRFWLILLTLLVLSACSGQPADGAGSIIFGAPIGGTAPGAALPFARVSINAVDLFAVSDPSGRYTIPGVPNGTYTLRVAKWNTALFTIPLPVDPANHPFVDLGVRSNSADNPSINVVWPTLGVGTSGFSGRVVDAAGNGINEVEVLLVYANGSFARTVSKRLFVAAAGVEQDGHFIFADLPDNPARLIMGQDGFMPIVIENPFTAVPDTGGGHDTGDLNLARVLPDDAIPATVRVYVKDADGTLLPDVPVHLSLVQPEIDPIDRFGTGGLTGSDGHWGFIPVPGGHTYQVWAGDGTHLPSQLTITLAPGEDRQVTLTLTPWTGQRHPYL